MSTLNSSHLFSAEGLVCVVTGGGSGIGKMIADALDTNGAKAVYILGRRKELLEEVASKATNKSLIPLQCDVTSKDSLKTAADRVRSEQGKLNVLIANSGIGGVDINKRLPSDRKPSVKEFVDGMWEPSMEEFTQALHVNVTGVFYTTLAFLELLDEGNKARKDSYNEPTSQVIITSSIAAFNRVPALGFSYGASKAATTHMAKQLATYFAEYSIRVNTIAPGMYYSDMTEHVSWMQGQDARKEGSVQSKMIPATRVGREEDMAANVLFLVGRGSGYVNGNVLLTDGGRLGVGPATY